MNRRTFIQTTSLATLRWMALSAIPATLTTACAANGENSLNIRVLQNSIPPQLLRQFRATLEKQVNLQFTPEAQLSDLFNLLRSSAPPPQAQTQQQLLPFRRQTPPSLDLITLGNYWLTPAIEQKLIQPLNIAQLPNWRQLPARWQQLVRRNAQGELDPKGQVWAAPYRWGTTVLAYRRDRFRDLGWVPTDWSDLWRPELAGKISLLDQPREVIGLTLKKLGLSYNTADLDSVNNLKAELRQLNRQAKFYSSNHYLEPLITGDTSVAVGWSADVLAAMERYKQINAVVPLSGTALWADLWVRPVTAGDNVDPLIDQWINFCWELDKADAFSLLTNGTSPTAVGRNRREVSKELREHKILLPPEPILQRSEFLLPLSPTAAQEYLSYWEQMRSETES